MNLDVLYTMGATDEQWNIIWDCEKKSAITCERCGKPGKINKSTGWLKTLCPDCGKEWEDKSAENGIVEVADDEVSVLQVKIR